MASRTYFDQDGEPLLTPAEAAKRIGVNIETMRRWLRKRAIPFVEVGPYRRRRIRRGVVEQQRVTCST